MPVRIPDGNGCKRGGKVMAKVTLPDTDPTLPVAPRDLVELVAERLTTIHERSRISISNVLSALFDVYPEVLTMIRESSK